MDKKIFIGIFKDSQGEDSLQISADVYGLIDLQDVFKHLANKLDRFDFSDLPLLDKKFRINLVAYSDALDVGLKDTGNGNYEWRQTKEKWYEFREKLLRLCYDISKKSLLLECGAAGKDDLQVTFSLDEFNQFYE